MTKLALSQHSLKLDSAKTYALQEIFCGRGEEKGTTFLLSYPHYTLHSPHTKNSSHEYVHIQASKHDHYLCNYFCNFYFILYTFLFIFETIHGCMSEYIKSMAYLSFQGDSPHFGREEVVLVQTDERICWEISDI